jgi:hypothetical protein
LLDDAVRAAGMQASRVLRLSALSTRVGYAQLFEGAGF